MAPLTAWFTLQGDLVGVSGIAVRLVAGQAVDSTAWYSTDGYRAAIAGPFRNEAMNKQGYLRGSQIVAAEKLARAAQRPGQPSATVQAMAPAPQGGLKLLDWTRVRTGSPAAGERFTEWDLAANQPNGVTAPQGAILEEAGQFGRAIKVRFFRAASRLDQFTVRERTNPHNAREAKDRHHKTTTTSLDVAVGVVGRLGSIGLAISTVYFIVDTAVALSTNGRTNIPDVPGLLFSPHAAGPLSIGTPRHSLEVAADPTRVPMPRRTATPALSERLRQTSWAAHNAVFRPATG